MDPSQYHIIDPHGDVEVLVEDAQFLVLSSSMRAISPKFQELFYNAEGRTIRLHENCEAFHWICQSAHSIFVPQAIISPDTLVHMALIVGKYAVPPTSSVHALVNFCFIVQTLRPGKISSERLHKLLQVAKALDSAKFRRLLADVFLFRSPSFEPFAINEGAHNQPDSGFCALLLANIAIKSAACKLGISRLILRQVVTASRHDRCASQAQELRSLEEWISTSDPCLHDIAERLNQSLNIDVSSMSEASMNIWIHDIQEHVSAATLQIEAMLEEVCNKTTGAAPSPASEQQHVEVQDSDDDSSVSYLPLRSGSTTDVEDIDRFEGDDWPSDDVSMVFVQRRKTI